MKRENKPINPAIPSWVQFGKAAAIPGIRYAIEQLEALLADLQGGLQVSRLPQLEEASPEEAIEAMEALTVHKPKPQKWGRRPSKAPDFLDGWYTKHGVAKALEMSAWNVSNLDIRSRTARVPGMSIPPINIYDPAGVAKEAKRRGIILTVFPPAAATKEPKAAAGKRSKVATNVPEKIDGWLTKWAAMEASGYSRARIEHFVRAKQVRSKHIKHPSSSAKVAVYHPEDIAKLRAAREVINGLPEVKLEGGA